MRLNSALLLCLLLAVLAVTVLSQSTGDNSPNPNTPENSATKKPTETTKSPDPPAATAKTTSDDRPSPLPNLPKVSSNDPATSSAVRITATNTDNSQPTGGLPGVSSLPALPTATRGRLFATPVASVPPTANAPFMQKSTLPEGTVFIAVGSALGLFALSVIGWRCLVAWSLHRSVKRAAIHANHSDSKTILRPPPGSGNGGIYTAGLGSTLSLDHLSSARPSTNPGRQPTPNSSLFFSPTTAGAGVVGGERRSQYFPPGLYAAGPRDSTIALPGHPNSSHTHLATHGASPTRYTPNRPLGITPPGSPLLGPTGQPPRAGSSHGGGQQLVGLRGNESHPSLNLPPTVRAPSAYLENLFENHQQHSPGGNNGRY